jgi:hypothetical protein
MLLHISCAVNFYNTGVVAQGCKIGSRIYNYNTSTVVDECFFNVGENIFVLKMLQATCGVVNFYNAGVVARSRRIGSGVIYSIAKVSLSLVCCLKIRPRNCQTPFYCLFLFNQPHVFTSLFFLTFSRLWNPRMMTEATSFRVWRVPSTSRPKE